MSTFFFASINSNNDMSDNFLFFNLILNDIDVAIRIICSDGLYCIGNKLRFNIVALLIVFLVFIS